MSAKQALIDDLTRSGEAAIARLRALPAERFAEGRYENGWNGREILAHLAAIEWTYGRLVDLASQPAAPDGRTERTAEVRGGMDEYNARQVAKRSASTLEELFAELEENRRRTIATVKAADEAWFEVAVRSAGGRTGTLAQVFCEVALGHLEQHAADILR